MLIGVLLKRVWDSGRLVPQILQGNLSNHEPIAHDEGRLLWKPASNDVAARNSHSSDEPLISGGLNADPQSPSNVWTGAREEIMGVRETMKLSLEFSFLWVGTFSKNRLRCNIMLMCATVCCMFKFGYKGN